MPPKGTKAYGKTLAADVRNAPMGGLATSIGTNTPNAKLSSNEGEEEIRKDPTKGERYKAKDNNVKALLT